MFSMLNNVSLPIPAASTEVIDSEPAVPLTERSPRLTLMPAVALVYLTVSRPFPPWYTSLPAPSPPTIKSEPSPPYTTSSPEPEKRVSLPSPPLRVSLPRPPTKLLSVSLPVMESSAREPSKFSIDCNESVPEEAPEALPADRSTTTALYKPA